jgi:hypothetical protein
MANYAGMQKSAVNSSPITAGLVTQALRPGDTSGYVAATDVVVGGPAFLVDSNTLNQSIQATGSSTNPFIGVIYRANTTASVDYYTVGYTTTISAGLRVEVITRGTVAVAVTQQGATPVVPAFGDIVFVLPSGVFFTQATAGGTLPSGAIQTNFRVDFVPAGTTAAAGQLVVITNRQNVGV